MTDILRYRGDIAASIDRDQMIGPDFGGRYMAVRQAVYDPSTDLTTVRLRGILPAEFRERVTAGVSEQQERDRIRELFNG